LSTTQIKVYRIATLREIDRSLNDLIGIRSSDLDDQRAIGLTSFEDSRSIAPTVTPLSCVDHSGVTNRDPMGTTQKSEREIVHFGHGSEEDRPFTELPEKRPNSLAGRIQWKVKLTIM
jgi:hypothetical protein